MNKSDIVKLRIEPQRKEAWKRYAENCLPELNLSELVTIAVDYFVSGKHQAVKTGDSRTFDAYSYSWIIPKQLGSSEYLRNFLSDADKELERKRDRNAKRLAGEYD